MAHPASGFYIFDGYEYVSVSSVMGATGDIFDPGRTRGLEFWRRNEDDWELIIARAQRRGKIIHAEVETTLLGTSITGHEDEASYDEMMEYNIHEYIMHLSPLLDLIKDENYDGNDEPKLDFRLERAVHCPHGYAGTPDGRFYWNGLYTIWDWKTVRSYTEFKDQQKAKKPKPRSKYKDAFIQIGAYALANNVLVKLGRESTMIKQGVICVCYDWREPQLHILDRDMLKQAALDFVARYEAYCDLMQAQFPRKLAARPAQEQLVEMAFSQT